MKFNPGRSQFLSLQLLSCLYLKVLAIGGRRFISKSIGKKQKLLALSISYSDAFSMAW
jgi:hypothetical protein